MLLRSGPGGPEVYLTRRAARSRFMPDAFVFPGGAVDAADRDDARALLAVQDGSGPRDADVAALTLRITAIRELFEEAGILLARDAAGAAVMLEAQRLASLRREAMQRGALGPLLAEGSLRPDVAALAYYSNWITPASEPIRFDAHFFVARIPAGQTAVADAVEVHDGVWLAPAGALAASDRGELAIRFPTRKHLERLAGFDDLDALFAHAGARSVAPVLPVIREGGSFAFDEDAW